jgi:hypothetical protein
MPLLKNNFLFARNNSKNTKINCRYLYNLPVFRNKGNTLHTVGNKMGIVTSLSFIPVSLTYAQRLANGRLHIALRHQRMLTCGNNHWDIVHSFFNTSDLECIILEMRRVVSSVERFWLLNAEKQRNPSDR